MFDFDGLTNEAREDVRRRGSQLRTEDYIDYLEGVISLLRLDLCAVDRDY